MNEKISRMNERWMQNFMKLIMWIVCLLAVIEYILYFPLDRMGMTYCTFQRYLLIDVVEPFAVGMLVCFFSQYFLRRIKDREMAMYVPFVALTLESFLIACIHNMFPLTMCVYLVPIVMSGIFGRRRLTLIITLMNCVCLAFSSTLPIYDFALWNELHFVYLTIAYVFIIITYLLIWKYISYNKERIKLLEESIQIQSELKSSLIRDKLTGLYNHTGYQQYMNELFDQAVLGMSFIAVMIDIDDFKKINDVYGHENGNKVLCGLSGLLTACVDGDGYACRYGGEEFVLLFQNIDLENVLIRLKKLKKEAAAMKFDFAMDRGVTFSGGAVVYTKQIDTAAAMIVCADEAMYRAKKRGKDCICICG